MILFPMLFIAPGLAALVFGGSRALDGMQSAGWPTTDGTIVYAARRSSQSVDLVIAYDYSVSGSPYRSTQRSFSFSSARVGEYTVGQRVRVFYKPGQPSNAVLHPGMGTAFAIPLFGAVFALIGVYIGTLVYREG